MGLKETAGQAWGKYRSWPTWVQVVIAIIVLAVVAGLFGDADDTATNETQEEAATNEQGAADTDDQEAQDEPERTPEEQLRAAVQDALGETNRDVDRISSFEAEEGGRVSIEWAIDENLTEGLTKDTARSEGVDILEAVKESGFDYRIVEINGTYPLVDQLGNETEERVIRAQYSRKLINQINFENFDFKNVYELDDSTYVHPAFRY